MDGSRNQTSADGVSQFSPPSAEVYTCGSPGTAQARTTVAEGATASSALAGSGTPFIWTGPGWHGAVPAFCQAPSIGPEYSAPSGASRYPRVEVSASIADVAIPPLLSPLVAA